MKNRRESWVPVEGRVIERPTRWETAAGDSTRTLLEYLLVEYTWSDGITRTVQSSSGRQSIPWRKAPEAVAVLVNPADPAEAHVVTSGTGFHAGAALGFVIAAVIAAALLLASPVLMHVLGR